MQDDTGKITSTDIKDYAVATSKIKEAIERCRYRSLAKINREALSLYFGVGKYVSENTREGKWGQNAIATISTSLQKEMPGLRGFSETGIRRMRIFYEEWASFVIHPTSLDELVNAEDAECIAEDILLKQKQSDFVWSDFVSISFSHHIEIITKTKDIDARLFYIHQSALHSWSLSKLKVFCNENLYEHQGAITNNFHKSISNTEQARKAIFAFKDEYLLDMVNVENVGEREEDWNEKVLEKQIVNNMRDFILRFGVDFIFIGSQHRLVIEGEEMFADLVFFNRDLNANVIVELKRGKFRPNYLGQISAYLAAYDKLEKKSHENPSIGIILCHDANKKFVEFFISTYDQPLGVATYRTADEMPEKLKKILPDIEKLKEVLNNK